MPQYAFRVRFDIANTHRIGCDAEEIRLLTLPTGQILRLRTAVAGTRIKDHSRAAVLGAPYDSNEEAWDAAQRAKAALLCWAVEQRLGIDFGDGRQRSMVTNAGLALLRERIGGPVRNDIQGIDVYEVTENLTFVRLHADVTVGKNPDSLIETFRKEFLNHRQLTDKQVLASEIYSGSFFDISPRSRFITLITAIEALLELKERPGAVQEIVTGMESLVQETTLDDPTKKAIIGSLQWLRKTSIGQSGRQLANQLLPDRQYNGRSAPQFFKYCYDLRSDILHRGTTGDATIDLSSLAGTADAFVADLLLASFRSNR